MDTKIDPKISDLTNLQTHPGWQLVIESMNQHIANLREQLEEGVQAESKEDSKNQEDLIRLQIKIYKDVKDTPQLMIADLSAASVEPINDDPYFANKEEIDKSEKSI